VQPADSRARFGLELDDVEVLLDPFAERAGLAGRVEAEYRARCMTSSMTVALTPPAACSSFMPRL
jgi:hypothetical protein